MAKTFTSKKYLLVASSDEETLNSILEIMKFNYGNKVPVVLARDGIDVTAKIHYQGFNCIVVDTELPKKNTHAVLNAIRGNELNENTPIIMLAEDQKQIPEDEFQFLYHAKTPIEPQKLFEQIVQQLKLGLGDQRVSARLLNIICESIIKFIKSYSQGDCQVKGPFLATTDQSLSDYNQILQVVVEKSKTRFFLSIDESTVDQMKANLSFLKDSAKDQIARSLAVFTLKQSIAQLNNPFQIKSNVQNAEEEHIKEQDGKKGIGLQITSADGAKINLFVVPDPIS